MPGGMRGRLPAPDDQRRRSNKPVSYGRAEATTARAAAKRPTLGITKPHPMIRDLWVAVQGSAEAPFYSDADWRRLRLELSYGNQLMMSGRIPGAQAWATFQAGLNELMISPAVKRRAGVDLKPVGADPDEVAAEAAVADAQRALAVVR